MKKTLLVLALVAVVAVVPLLAACSCGGGTSLTESDIKTIRGFSGRLDSHDQSISKIQSELAKLDTATLGKLATLDADALTKLAALDLDTLLSDVSQLKKDRDEDNARIKVLEDNTGTGGNGGDGTAELLTTRWQPSIELETTIQGLYIDQLSWYPTRIKDQNTYRITFDIVNETEARQPNQVLMMVFVPSNKDTSIDIANTGLYPVSPLSLSWNYIEYSPSSGVDCRRIEFCSDEFNIEAGDTISVKVDFDLYYAK